MKRLVYCFFNNFSSQEEYYLNEQDNSWRFSMQKMEIQEIGTEKKFYGNWYPVLKEAESAIINVLTLIEKEYFDTQCRFPVEHYKTRIKTAESAKGKLVRLNFPQNAESALINLYDVVGVRIVCQFIEDIYALKQTLFRIENIEVVKIKDYIKTPKPNGYRSLHIILGLPIQNFDVTNKVYIEVQLRTIAMDFWASLEHELKYKKNIPDTNLMFSELKRCADEIASVDLSMETIYEWIKKSC
jgi:putative GTP pyrophosphokinase